MPTISTFYGVVIGMFWLDHAPPHFHAMYAEDEASIDIRTLLLFRGITRPFALGANSGALDWYERETGDDITIPGADEVIGRLGGAELMVKIRTVTSADERYPAAMMRMRRLIADIRDGALSGQLAIFLERAVLSRLDKQEPDSKKSKRLGACCMWG